jgi:capsular polysaccharide biosynthesis protein
MSFGLTPGLSRWVRTLAQNPIAKLGNKTLRRFRIAALSLARGTPALRTRFHLPANRTVSPLTAGGSGGMTVSVLQENHAFRRRLPDLPEDYAARPFYAARNRETPSPGYVASFSDGYIWGYSHGAVFTRDGHFVPEFTRDPWGAALHGVWTRHRLPRKRRVAGRMLYLVTPEAANNYHHWMIDLLPRIGTVLRAGYALSDFDTVVVNHSNAPFQLATLEHLGIDRSRVVAPDPGVCLQADELVVPSLKPSNEAVPSEDIRFLRDSFLGKTPRPRPKRRLFLSRRDAQMRRLTNETELAEILGEHGIETITPGSLSVPEQAALFADAELVIGNGAGLANLAFATPGARVLELATPRWLTVYHWMISARLALHHSILVADGQVHAGDPKIGDRHEDFSLQPAKFRRAVQGVVTATTVARVGLRGAPTPAAPLPPPAFLRSGCAAGA